MSQEEKINKEREPGILFLNLFRKLTPAQQEEVLTYIKGFEVYFKWLFRNR